MIIRKGQALGSVHHAQLRAFREKSAARKGAARRAADDKKAADVKREVTTDAGPSSPPAQRG